MEPEAVNNLFSLLEKIIFLLQVLCISTSFLCGFSCVNLYLSGKNQRNLL